MVFSSAQYGAEHCIIFSSLVFCSISPMKVHAQLQGLLLRYSYSGTYRGGSRGRVQGVRTPPEMTCGFLINTVESASQLYKICFIIWYVFSAVHIMLLPSRKPSSSYSLLKFVYVTSQLRHSLVVHPLLRKILDPPLHIYMFDITRGRGTCNNLSALTRFLYIEVLAFSYILLLLG